ncbi:MAG: hypothetical protein HW390_2390 [Candidatus Brocadiaceae bacterium]|nr:hypothetical protein [Candidatus Brocadiaceae bacterium]
MSSCSKSKAVMVVLVGIFGLLCVGFAVSVTEKYKLQKERVHALERQLGAGRKEVLKVPELMENLDKVAAEKKEVEEKFAACASEKDGLTTKVAELQKEVDTFGAVKVAVGVQIGGAQNTIMEQQNKLNGLEEARNKLSEQIAALEAENKKIAEQSAMQIVEVKRGNEDAKNQLVYYIEAKKIADKEIADKQKAIADLQHAKEALEGELAKIKEKPPSAAPQGSSSMPQFPLDSSMAADLDKSFALLRERITSPSISLSEVSILLSRMESTLKNMK